MSADTAMLIVSWMIVIALAILVVLDNGSK